MPAWLAVLIVLVVTAGAGYAGWKLLAPPPPADLSQYESNDGKYARARRPGGPQPAVNFVIPAQPPPIVEGVTLNPDGSGTAQTASFGVRFQAGDKPSLVAMNRLPRQSGPDAQAMKARAQALNEVDARKAAGVTDEQIARLRTISFTPAPAVDAETRKKLLALWAGCAPPTPPSGPRPKRR